MALRECNNPWIIYAQQQQRKMAVEIKEEIKEKEDQIEHLKADIDQLLDELEMLYDSEA